MYQVEILAAVVSWIAHDSGAETIIDVGSGQVYIASLSVHDKELVFVWLLHKLVALEQWHYPF